MIAPRPIRVPLKHAQLVALAYAGTDFTFKVVREVCEERLNFAIERPAAIVHVSGLPTAAPTEAAPTRTSARM
jgi:hypothetical protein